MGDHAIKAIIQEHSQKLLEIGEKLKAIEEIISDHIHPIAIDKRKKAKKKED